MSKTQPVWAHALDAIAELPTPEVRRELTARVLEGRYLVREDTARVDVSRAGRPDTRSLTYDVLVDGGEHGWLWLCEVRRRNVAVGPGYPPAQAEAREFLQRLGATAPDDLRGLTG